MLLHSEKTATFGGIVRLAVCGVVGATLMAACSEAYRYTTPPGFTAPCTTDCSLVADLSYDDNGSVLDLHVRRSSDPVCSAQDCFKETCGQENNTISWGATLFDESDAGPAGPQRVVVETPENRDYELDAWLGTADPTKQTHATMTLHCAGSFVGTQSVDLVEHEMWRTWTVHDKDGNCTVDELSQAVPTATCTTQP